MPGQASFTAQARAFMDVAFARNLGILSPAEQALLYRSRVAIPGLGGVGGLHCAALARLGVGAFTLGDPDTFELANYNRQYAASMRHLGASKLDAMTQEARQINPHLDIRGFPEGVTPQNLDAFLDGADAVVDGFDIGAINIRRALFNRARERGIPVVTAAPLGFTSSVLVFTADGMSFDDYFRIDDSLPKSEKLLRFAVGLAPRGLHISQIDPGRVSLERGRGPSLTIACLLCAGLAATQTVLLLTGRPGVRPAPFSMQVDPVSGRIRTARPRKGNASATQRAKLWFVRTVILGGEGHNIRQEPPEPETVPGAAAPAGPELAWMAQAAQQAPSGDNCQPWRFSMRDGALNVHLEPREDGSFFNFRQLASVIACGAAAQNVLAVAPGLGWTPRVKLLPDPADENLMAAVGFTPQARQADPLAEAVWSRCTNRRGYARRRSVDAFSQQALVDAASPAKAFLVDARDELRDLAGQVYLADRIRVERRDLHEHFMGMTRFDPPDGGDSPDGLPLKNLYAGAAGEVFLRATRSWNAMRAANLLGVGRLVAMHSRMAVRAGPMAALVCTDSPSVKGFLEGGMAMERFWLAATRLGLAVQPMTAITLFWLRWRLEGPDAFSRAHRRLLEGVWPRFEALFPGLGEGCWPVMLLRLGHARPIRHGTPRRPLSSAILD